MSINIYSRPPALFCHSGSTRTSSLSPAATGEKIRIENQQTSDLPLERKHEKLFVAMRSFALCLCNSQRWNINNKCARSGRSLFAAIKWNEHVPQCQMIRIKWAFHRPIKLGPRRNKFGPWIYDAHVKHYEVLVKTDLAYPKTIVSGFVIFRVVGLSCSGHAISGGWSHFRFARRLRPWRQT